MNAEEIIVSMAIKYRGEWNDIYAGLSDPQNRDLDEYYKIAQKMKCKYVTILSKDYPEYLKNSFKPPFVLFYYGDISLISNIGKNVAVVGSRTCSDYAVEATKDIVGVVAKASTWTAGAPRWEGGGSHPCLRASASHTSRLGLTPSRVVVTSTSRPQGGKVPLAAFGHIHK